MHKNKLNKIRLLISVTNIAEVQIALENGADLIDLKDPSSGALGALPPIIVESVVKFVKKTDVNILTSATVGDVPMLPVLLSTRVTEMLATNVDFVKIGFFETADYQPCLDQLYHISQAGARLIAVLFAEITYPVGLIQGVIQAGFAGIMIDTAQKNGLTLLDYYTQNQLKKLADHVLENDLILGFAGSLKSQHIESLMNAHPNYLGFRGGVCDKYQRTAELDPEKISLIKNLLTK